jgi:UDP-N-acetylglucosamine acyltransferase
MRTIHPTAVVDAGAQLGEDVQIGPYCVVGPHVVLGDGVRLRSHVVVDGHTTLGARCQVWPFASVGTQTQDLKFKGGAPRAEIGEETSIRECVTISAATADGDVTRIGSKCLLMANSHVGHDCVVGHEVILANSVGLSGHVTVEDQVILGGMTGVHQFVRIGRLAMIGGLARVTQDVPPFMLAEGNPLEVRVLNSIGLKRRGISEEAQAQLKAALRILYREGLSLRQALQKMGEKLEKIPEIVYLMHFLETTTRGVAR